MPKKILLVYAKSSLELLDRKSALGSYIFCLCELLQKNGMQVFVNGLEFDQLKNQSLTVKSQIGPGNKTLKKYIPKFFKEIIKDTVIFNNITQLYKNIASSGKYDCVLEFYNYASNVGYKIANKQNIPLVVVYDAPVLEEYVFFHGPKFIFKNKIRKRELETLKRANCIVAYSNAVKNYLNKIVNRNLNISIHQNVDFSRFDFFEKKFDDKSLKIGFIGSFLKWHRIDLLLEAFNRLRDNHYPVELFLIGYGMEYNSVKELVIQSKYKEFIVIPGFMDGLQLLEMKKQLHIGVMPGSNWYGAPNKIFEYGAAKMAVVAPDTLTINDLFEDEKELLLFKQDDGADLFLKLKKLCDDRILSDQLATALQQKIRNKYSEKITSDFYNRILTNAMHN